MNCQDESGHSKSKKLNEYLGLSADEDHTLDRDVDIEQMKKEIRALLVINEEIFTRCTTIAWVVEEAESQVSRVGYKQIKTRQKGSNLELITRAESSQQRFDTKPLSTIPNCFNGTIIVKYKDAPCTKFVDFDDLFQRLCMLVRDDALEVLLPKLKVHLASIQICLGCIDEWVMQPSNDLSFINSTFGLELKIPDVSYGISLLSRCQICGDFNDCCSCRVTVLFTKTNIRGQFNTSFDVSEEAGRQRLMRFVYFLTGNELSSDQRSFLIKRIKRVTKKVGTSHGVR